jgi:hypothetical protein
MTPIKYCALGILLVGILTACNENGRSSGTSDHFSRPAEQRARAWVREMYGREPQYGVVCEPEPVSPNAFNAASTGWVTCAVKFYADEPVYAILCNVRAPVNADACKLR